MKAQLTEHLTRLTTISAVSGSEQQMARTMYHALKPIADEAEADRFGNIIATRRGPAEAPRVMISAHSDEVGGIVTSILPSGYLRFQIVGFLNITTLLASHVLVGAKVHGVIGAPPAYLDDAADQCKTWRARDLFIDVGATDESEARSWGVSEGDPVSFVNPLWRLGNGDRLCSKAVDDRIGCALLLQLMATLSQVEVPLTVHAVVTVQEEVTMSGASMVSYRLQPDFALLVDTIPSDDTPGRSLADAVPIALGKGPVLQLAEGIPQAYRGTFAHPGVRDLLVRTAQQEGLPYQLSGLYGYWTTDAAAVHNSRGGVPCGFVSIPRRYAHTPSEVVDLNDAVAALQLLEAVVLKTGAGVDLRFVADLNE